MKRPDTITVKYRNEKFEAVKEQLVGFEARVFHHEFNHLMGKTIMSYEENQGETEVLSEARNELYLKELDVFMVLSFWFLRLTLEHLPLAFQSRERGGGGRKRGKPDVSLAQAATASGFLGGKFFVRPILCSIIAVFAPSPAAAGKCLNWIPFLHSN